MATLTNPTMGIDYVSVKTTYSDTYFNYNNTVINYTMSALTFVPNYTPVTFNINKDTSLAITWSAKSVSTMPYEIAPLNLNTDNQKTIFVFNGLNRSLIAAGNKEGYYWR